MNFHSVGNGMSSSQLLLTPSFFRGVGIPPTSYIPSGNLPHNYRKSPCYYWENHEHNQLSMAMFNSYVTLPEGKPPFSYGFPMVYQFVLLNYQRVQQTMRNLQGGSRALNLGLMFIADPCWNGVNRNEQTFHAEGHLVYIWL